MQIKKSKKQLRELFSNPSWTVDSLLYADEIISKIAKEKYKLDIYPNEFNICTNEQMLDAYAATGMPIMYNHWKFGKDYMANENAYKKGRMGVALEMILNTNPCISYNIEDNTTTQMIMVQAHAAQGHNHFFKNNYLFKQFTHADSIIDYLQFAKNYIQQCEDKYGFEEVESILDACHALDNYGVFKYKNLNKLSTENEKIRLEKQKELEQLTQYDLWRILPQEETKAKEGLKNLLKKPEENILYFLEKNSPKLKGWQKEIIRIIRKISQYFYPQSQSKTNNEGCLVEGSMIATKHGLMDIKTLVETQYGKDRPGEVWDGLQPRRVYDWFINENQNRIKITFMNGVFIHGGENHKLKVGDEWIALKDFKIGQEVISMDINSKLTKTTVKSLQKDVGTTYDFSVEGSHCYWYNGFINHNCATFMHHSIMNDLYDQEYLEEGNMLEFYENHAAVINQPGFTFKNYSGFNPYTLGFSILRDIKRLMLEPTEEDINWFPTLAGKKDWLSELHNIWSNFKDETMIAQYLSPKVMRDMKMFLIDDKEKNNFYSVEKIHDERGYKQIRHELSNSYSRSRYVPDLQILSFNKETRVLTILYTPYQDMKLNLAEAKKTIKYLQFLWGFPVRIVEKQVNDYVSILYQE